MQNILINTKPSKVRRVTRHGRSYLVADLSMLVPGVLAGSNGPIYYPPEEVAAEPERWNGVPIVVYHPQVNGQFVSARDPEIAESYEVGRVYRARINSKGHLRSEGWFDEELVKNVDPRVLENLESGIVMELSTGLNAVLDPAEEGAVDGNGVSYVATARNFQPDHLAVLPDQVGACSIAHGCGVMVNCCNTHNNTSWHQLVVNPKIKGGPKGLNKILEKTYQAALARYGSQEKAAKIAWGSAKKAGWHKSKSGGWQKRKKKSSMSNVTQFAPIIGNLEYDRSMADRFQDLQEALTERFGYDAYLSEVYDAYIIFRRGDKYLKLNYTEEEGYCVLDDGKPVKVRRTTVYEPINNGGVASLGGHNMPMNAQQRMDVINYLVSNCACWKSQGDKELLGGLSDEKLLELKTDADQRKRELTAANSAVRGFNDGKVAYRLNPETNQWEKGELTDEPVANKKPKKSDGYKIGYQDGTMEGMDEEAVRKKNRKRMMGRQTRNAADDQSQDDADHQQNTQQKARKPQTTDDWVRSAPEEIRNEWDQWKRFQQIEKNKIIEQLLANVLNPTDRQAHAERLSRRSLEDLQYDLAMRGATIVQKTEEEQARITNKRKNQGPPPDEDMLGMPAIDWQAVSGNQKSTKIQQSVANTDDSGYDYDNSEASEDDWLRSAPSSVRNRYISMRALEERERSQLIDQLVANVSDENAERRLVARLQNKSIDELRDLVAGLAPRQEGSRTNYFGSGTPSLGSVQNRTNNQANDPSEDVLELPTIDWSQVNGN